MAFALLKTNLSGIRIVEEKTPYVVNQKKASLDESSAVTPPVDNEQNDTSKPLCPNLQIRSAMVIGLYDTSRVDFLQGCRAWQCPVCGPKKRYQLLKRIELGNPNRFLTLTTIPIQDETPREVFKRTTKQVSKLFKPFKKANPDFRYARILESTKAGFPHYHFVLNSQFLLQRTISERWEKLTGARIVDIRKLYGKTIGYISKYLTKNDHVDYTRQRVSFSRNWPKLEKQKVDMQLENWDQIYNDELQEYSDYWHLKPGMADMGKSAIRHCDTEDTSDNITKIRVQFGTQE